MIELIRVGKRYGEVRAVEDVTLTVEKGDLCVLVGPSGSGKTTILRIINRLAAHTSGTIRFSGAAIESFRPQDLRRRMGYAIQSVGLFPHWTVEDNIATVPRLLRWDAGRIERRVSELLQLLGLDAARFRRAYPHELSGGQQQRVGVARALAADPDVLLMDEPFGALDPITRQGLQDELRRIHRETGKTILFVTHDVDEALFLATRIVVLDHGRIVQSGAPRDLLRAPADFVRRFLGGADLGLKLLAVESVGERMRVGDAAEAGEAIGAGESLRTALSRLVEAGRERIAVAGPDGGIIGALHLADIVRAPGPSP